MYFYMIHRAGRMTPEVGPIFGPLSTRLRVDLNPLKKRITRSYVRNVRIDFPTLFLNWYQKKGSLFLPASAW